MADNPYSQPTLTGYNATPPSDDGTVIASNQLNWSKHINKIGDPLRSFATDMDANVLSAFAKTINIGDAQANPLSGSLAFVSDTLTIVSGSVTPDRSHHLIDTESGASADFLDTIATGSVGDETILYLNSVSAARIVSIRDGVGNIHLARTESSTELDLDVNRPLVLIRNGTDWYQVEPIADKIESRNAGAAGAPDFTLYRNSATPAISDVLGRILYDGEDSAGNEEIYALTQAIIIDPTSATEDGAFAIQTVVGGTLAERMRVHGSDIGIGTTLPTARLHIVNSATATFVAGNVAPTLLLAENQTGVGGAIGFQGVADNAGTGNTGAIVFSAGADGSANNNTLSFYAEAQNNLIGLTLDGTGRLGINSTSPDYVLHAIATATDVANFESSAAAANIWLQDSGSADNKSVGIGSVGDTLDLYAGAAAQLTLASGGTLSGNVVASVAEADAGTATGLLVTPEGLEEIRKRLRGQTTNSATAISMTATMAGELIRTTATGAVTFTVPQDTMTQDDVVHVYQEAAGQVTMTAGGSVVLNNANGLKTGATDSVISLFFLAANLAVVTGDTAA